MVGDEGVPYRKVFPVPSRHVTAACFHEPHNISPELLKSSLEAHPNLLDLVLRGAPSRILSLKDAIEEDYPNILIAL